MSTAAGQPAGRPILNHGRSISLRPLYVRYQDGSPERVRVAYMYVPPWFPCQKEDMSHTFTHMHDWMNAAHTVVIAAVAISRRGR
jgi:hypothetical protein